MIEEYKFKRLLGLIQNAFIKCGQYYIYLYGTECKVVTNPVFCVYESKDSIGYKFCPVEREQLDVLLDEKVSYYMEEHNYNSFNYVNVFLANYENLIFEGLIDDLKFS
jgi:hypothetical protein